MLDNIVIVGAGLGGWHAADELRSLGFDGGITLIGDETAAPYDRTKLSKDFLIGTLRKGQFDLGSPEWAEERNVRLELGVHATAIDRAAKRVRLDSGRSLPYDRLVLATGSDSRTLGRVPSDVPGVRSLRSLADAEQLDAAFERGGRLAIVGAGWIGLEVASAATQRGLDVTIAAPGSEPLASVLGPRMGEHFARLHRSHGVELRMRTNVEGLITGEDGAAAGVSTSTGDVRADGVLVAVGAAPRIRLAVAAHLSVVDGAVEVDARLRTSDPSILAIGDIANAWNARVHARVRREHWDTAIRHGRLAARSILGLSGEHDWLPYFFTDQFDLGMEYVGLSEPTDDVVVRGDEESGEFIAFWLRHGAVTAGMNVNVWDVNDDIRALVGRTVDVDRLVDLDVPITEV